VTTCLTSASVHHSDGRLEGGWVGDPAVGSDLRLTAMTDERVEGRWASRNLNENWSMMTSYRSRAGLDMPKWFHFKGLEPPNI
jgi:hypothetical protein